MLKATVVLLFLLSPALVLGQCRPGWDPILNTTTCPPAASGSSPTGAAGGSLGGTYPNPSIATSVALPGSPTTTTQTAGDNSTKVATTAYVDAIGVNNIADGAGTNVTCTKKNVSGMPAMQCVVPYTAFSISGCNSTTCNVTGPVLPAGFKVIGITVLEATQFACGGCTNTASPNVFVSIGPSGNYTAYFPAVKIMQTTGTYTDWPSGWYSYTNTGTNALFFQFTNTQGSGGNFASSGTTLFTAGSLTVTIVGAQII